MGLIRKRKGLFSIREKSSENCNVNGLCILSLYKFKPFSTRGGSNGDITVETYNVARP
jgi:hypothetical protein